MEPLLESRGGSVRHERECTLPTVLLPVSLPAERGRADIALASTQAVCISSDQDIANGVMQDQGGASISELIAPNWPNQPWFPDLTELLVAPPWPIPIRKDMLSQVSGSVWHPSPELWGPSCVAASGFSEELSALQSRMLDTLTEARAPSTRHLYALKWGVFVKWCGQAHIDPATCTVSDIDPATCTISDVLSFLQYRLDSGSLPLTLKVYVAAIASFRSLQSRQLIGRHAMVVSFLKGAKRLHPPCPPSVPPWDLEVVLRALSQPTFESLTSVSLKELSLKTTLLLALASAKRIEDLHAFSVDSDCIRFGPGNFFRLALNRGSRIFFTTRPPPFSPCLPALLSRLTSSIEETLSARLSKLENYGFDQLVSQRD